MRRFHVAAAAVLVALLSTPAAAHHCERLSDCGGNDAAFYAMIGLVVMLLGATLLFPPVVAVVARLAHWHRIIQTQSIKAIFSNAANQYTTFTVRAKNGVRISGWTRHGLNRAIGISSTRVGTRITSIADALKNPISIKGGFDSLGRPVQVFIGRSARVVINPQTGQIVSVNPLSRLGVR